MTRLIFIAPATPSYPFQAPTGTIIDEYSQEWCGGWDYYRRGLQSSQDPSSWLSGWSWSSGILGGDSSVPLDQIRSGLNWDNQWQSVNNGNAVQKFILGVVYDQNGSTVAGATVEAFLTSTDQKVGTAVSMVDGSYQCPTPYPAVNHYVMATYPNGTSGVTVNTLVPTNSDGS